jgi:hypothetical protein
MGKQEISCPRCEHVISAYDVDWIQLRAHCHDCDLELPLTEGYVEDPEARAAAALEAFRPRPMKQPRGMRLEQRAAPGVESVKIGGTLFTVQVRLERERLILKGLFGREHPIPLEQVLGFAALQHIHHLEEPGQSPGEVSWHVAALLDDGMMLRIWEYERSDHARFLASKLNEIHQRVLSSKTPYRD